MVMEDYPELKADESLRDLHDELTSTENRVTYARQAYSDSVMRYNTEREQFPAVIVANTCNFNEADLFDVFRHCHVRYGNSGTRCRNAGLYSFGSRN